MTNDVRIPIRISPDPILEAVVELRFSTSVPNEAVFGLIYGQIQSEFSSYEALPVLQIPEAVRNQDEKLKYTAHYRVKSSDFHVNIGPKVIAIVNPKPYTGWDEYIKIISHVLEKLGGLNFISSIERIGVRYLDFFEGVDISPHLVFGLRDFPYKDNGQMSISTAFTPTLPDGNGFSLNTTLRISSSNLMMVNNQLKPGSILDADTYCDLHIGFDKEVIQQIISDAHKVDKEVFFSLLKEEFIETLNPVYE